MERKVRGSVLNSYLKFINKKWGKEGGEQCLRDITWEGRFVEGMYYPDEIREKILIWIRKEKGEEYIREAGNYVVKNLGLLSWIVRFANPKILAKKFPDNYNEVYSFGRVEVDTQEDNVIFIRLFDVNRIKESCLSWQGVCEGAMEITKAKGTVQKMKCQVDGDEYCEYRLEY
jgi:hypothetical protein